MSIRWHIILMMFWRVFWPFFGATVGFVLGSLLLMHREVSAFRSVIAAVFVVVGVFVGMGIGFLDALKNITVRCPKCGERSAKRTNSDKWNYHCQACHRTIKTGWRESDPNDFQNRL